MTVSAIGNITCTQNTSIKPIQVSVSGGQTSYEYALSSTPATGSGLTIDSSSGSITGTPTQASTFTLTVTVTDKANKTATESFSMAVSLNSHFFFLHKYLCFCIFSRLSTQNNRVLTAYKQLDLLHLTVFQGGFS